ncbi:hypothetical protein GW17_00010257 [Ensete ventricosum]|nr:hypothetical protein GW17_00010257 [Ensete ventricosum]
MATTMVAKAADGDVVGVGSFTCVRRWRRKLWSCPSAMEGAAHKSSNNGGNCVQKLDFQTLPSAVKEASDVCVGSGGNNDSRGEPGMRKALCMNMDTNKLKCCKAVFGEDNISFWLPEGWSFCSCACNWSLFCRLHQVRSHLTGRNFVWSSNLFSPLETKPHLNH